jgi:predicted ATPase
MLKRVKIRGYKSLVDVEVNLQPLSVFFGPNASGKSNFLDALQLLSRIATSKTLNEAFEPPYRGKPLESFTFGPDGVEGLLLHERASFSFEVDVELSPSVVASVESQYQVLEENKSKTFVEEKYLRYFVEIEINPKTGALDIAGESLVALDASNKPTEQKIWMERDRLELYRKDGGLHFNQKVHQSMLSLPYYIPAYVSLRAMHEELMNWAFFYLEPHERMRTSSPVKEVYRIGLMGEELNAFLNTLRAVNERQFVALERALHVFMPSITGIDVSVNNIGDVELRLMQGETPISGQLLSEGTLHILGLLALSSSTEPITLLGLEEPESGVHPNRLDLIALLLETRARGNTQVLATTHSPTLIDFIPDESLYSFNQDNGKTVITPLSYWRTTHFKTGRKRKAHEDETPISERIVRGDFNA